MTVSLEEMERWKAVNTFYCERIKAQLSPERCRDNRHKPPLGKVSDPRSVEGGVKLIHSGGYRPSGCATCTEWEILCEGVYARREGRDMKYNRLEEKELIRMAVALQKAASIREASKDLGLKYTALLERIKRNDKLLDIASAKGWPLKRLVSIEEVRKHCRAGDAPVGGDKPADLPGGAAAGPMVGEAAAGAVSGGAMAGEDIPPHGPPASEVAFEEKPSGKQEGLPEGPTKNLGDIFSVSPGGVVPLGPMVTISIQISGVDLGKLDKLIKGIHEGFEVGDMLHTRVPL